MRKATREMTKILSSVDVILEVLDARAPVSTSNPVIKEITQGKPIITLLNKSDLSDPIYNEKWIDYFKQDKQHPHCQFCWDAERNGVRTQRNSTFVDLTKLKKIYRIKDKLIKDNKNWVLQEYLKKPLLYNKKKFHIRAYVILSDTGKGFLASSFLVILAKKEYRVSNLEDKEIHDTHRDNVSEIIDDRNFGLFNQEEYLKIKKAIVKISKIFIQKAKVECYNNVKDCFHIFGLDIMFEKDYNPIFIEANITPGTLRYNYLLEGIMQEIVDKKFPPKNKIKRNNHLIKL